MSGKRKRETVTATSTVFGDDEGKVFNGLHELFI